MSKGFFWVSRDTTDIQDIHFKQIELAAGDLVPPEQLDLKDKVESTLTTIRILFGEGKDLRFDQYFRPLLSLAQLGLVGESANPAVAQRALASLQNEIVAREGGTIKNGYMKKLGTKALVFGLPAVLAALLLDLFLEDRQVLSGFFYLWAGCMAGVWLSFGTRNVAITFDELAVLEKDRLSPTIRLAFAGVLTMVIGLIIATKAAVLELGGLSTADFDTDVKVALLIGTLCGVSELALSGKVFQHAKDFLGVK